MEVNLTQIQIHRCAKCGTVTNIRHHMGCDRYFGKFHKPFAKNYKRYFQCVYLCITCHAIIHVIYKKQRLLRMRSRSKKVLQKLAVKRRAMCIEVCKQWLSGRDFDVTMYDYRVMDLLRLWKQPISSEK